MPAPSTAPLPESTIDAIIVEHSTRTGDVLGILERIQEEHPAKFLPRETLHQVSSKLGIAQSQIFSVVTFYSFFNLKPQGRHTLMVCRGTACHTRGSRGLLDSLRVQFDAPEGDVGEVSFTTPDHGLTIRTVACFGQCALAPVVAVDEEIHSYVSDVKLKQVVKNIQAA